MTNIKKIARFITRARFSDLPSPVVDKAKELTLDAFGVQLAASTLPWSKAVFRYCRDQGGAPQCTIVNYGARTSMVNAAFINGTFGHGFEMDDNHARTSLKCGSVAVPSALAVAEHRLCTGRDYILALVVGYELMTRVGLMVGPGLFDRGSHATGSIGAIGSAAIAGKLLGLDETTIAHALSLGANHMVGFGEVPSDGRGHIKRTYGGMAAAGGVRAALLAAEGITGAMTTLDPGSGFCRAFDADSAREDALTAGLGLDWEILNVHYKIYAQDGYIQPMTEALENIRREHKFTIDEIDEVRVGTNSRALNEVVGLIREPRTLTDAQFSATFSVAQYLVKGGAGFRDYSEENLDDPDIRKLSERVILEIDEQIESEFKKTRPRGARVEILLKSGKRMLSEVTNLRSMKPDEVKDKFRDLSQVVLSPERSERLLTSVDQIDRLPNVSCIAGGLAAQEPVQCVG